MAPHSSTLAWKIPWTKEPGRLQSMGSLGVGHDWANSLSLFTFMHWRRKWQATPVFLPAESQGWGRPGRLPSLGSHRVGHDWSSLAAAAETFRASSVEVHTWSGSRSWASSQGFYQGSSQLFLINGMITHYCLTYGKIPSGPVSWERCVLKTTPVKAKILCAVAIQIEKEGGRGDKIEEEGPSDYPNVAAPLASQAAFS